ncbi:hypothetical protein [Aureimonas pseudogalii]|uniref:Fructose-bisphosphate aldolase n=1 Tax=Aureimonas pseudogalii TaxID=1744844 RepID=A0A7W6EAQ5_9HYPH|nr:hypothetical protein [Aureimonas pseudogalii]MBB3997868.1 hypothetical protein [Aureimonas pseudogalii]
MTRLDRKLASIHAGTYKRSDFVIADAKDPDMGSGPSYAAPRRSPDGTVSGFKTRAEFLQGIKEIVEQDIVDIMLTSVSNLEKLVEMGVFEGSDVKPAIRANDATDCWGGIRGHDYNSTPSRPFRSANLDRVMKATVGPNKGQPLTDLGLYSVTFNNDVESDVRSLEAFSRFRADAAAVGMKYFYEVFNPNVNTGIDPDLVPHYVNDCLIRSLSGVSQADRPLFLKIPYNGPKAMEELASFDPTLIVGVLGGGAGTARDTFEIIWQAEKYGARLALFGRKINQAEVPLEIVKLMRHVADGDLTPTEAVKSYHATLATKGLTPIRSPEDDAVVTEPQLKAGASA